MKGPSSSIPTERLSEGWSSGIPLDEVLYSKPVREKTYSLRVTRWPCARKNKRCP
jgi:hypothetical protein